MKEKNGSFGCNYESHFVLPVVDVLVIKKHAVPKGRGKLHVVIILACSFLDFLIDITHDIKQECQTFEKRMSFLRKINEKVFFIRTWNENSMYGPLFLDNFFSSLEFYF